jgi:hypothetical protein
MLVTRTLFSEDAAWPARLITRNAEAGRRPAHKPIVCGTAPGSYLMTETMPSPPSELVVAVNARGRHGRGWVMPPVANRQRKSTGI